MGKHRIRHSGGGIYSWSIPGVGVLRVRCQTALNKPPATSLRACMASTSKFLAQMNKSTARRRRHLRSVRPCVLPRPSMAGAFSPPDRSSLMRYAAIRPGCGNRMQFDQLKRREFITLLGGAAATWSFTAHAQQRTMPVIGYLGPESPTVFASRVRAFRQGLGETGYAEGRNVAIEFRWAESQHSRLPALAADLVARQVAVIVAPGGAPAALAAKSVTSIIPIVFEMGADPIAIGLVNSLNRPGGNLTGVSSLNVGVTPKRLEILHEAVPTAGLVAVLVNPTSPTADSQLRSLQPAAQALGLQF